MQISKALTGTSMTSVSANGVFYQKKMKSQFRKHCCSLFKSSGRMNVGFTGKFQNLVMQNLVSLISTNKIEFAIMSQLAGTANYYRKVFVSFASMTNSSC